MTAGISLARWINGTAALICIGLWTRVLHSDGVHTFVYLTYWNLLGTTAFFGLEAVNNAPTYFLNRSLFVCAAVGNVMVSLGYWLVLVYWCGGGLPWGVFDWIQTVSVHGGFIPVVWIQRRPLRMLHDMFLLIVAALVYIGYLYYVSYYREMHVYPIAISLHLVFVVGTITAVLTGMLRVWSLLHYTTF